ncbi:hypothetical protein ACWGE0_06640 [Lentzea sp. NPDC054927]
MHDDVAVGTELRVSAPVNRFPLHPSPRYLFIAGGIGITPIRAMVRRLCAQGHPAVRLLYMTQSAEETPFLHEFSGPEDTVHHSDDHGLLDLWPHLAEPDDDVRVYCCGPAPLMRAVRTLTAHWRASRIHLEQFSADLTGISLPFTAVWAPDGLRVCGTCRLAVLAGGVEHRDSVLTDEERLSSVVARVSCAVSSEIVVGPHDHSRKDPS